MQLLLLASNSALHRVPGSASTVPCLIVCFSDNTIDRDHQTVDILAQEGVSALP